MRKHPARLAAVGISPARYDELKSICRQYREYKRKLERARAGIVDRPEGRGAWHRPDPTGSAAMRLADHPAAKRLKLIESCAAAVAEPAVAGAILKYACEGVGYDFMRPRPPVGRNQFYILALLFYIELDRALDGET